MSDWWDDVSQWSQPEPARHLQIIIYTAWNLWKERCRRIFDNRALTQDQLVTVITSDIANYYIAAHATVGVSLPYNFLTYIHCEERLKLFRSRRKLFLIFILDPPL